MKGENQMMTFIMTYWNEMLIAVSGIISGASALAALTPTPRDDAFWSKIKKAVDLVALNVRYAKPATA